MDRLRTAPTRAVREADAPQRTGRHGAPPTPSQTPSGRAPTPAPRRPLPEPRPVRRVVIGVLIGALTMLGVAVLDTFAGATVPVLGTLASLPVPATEREARAVEAPPSIAGTCLSWTRPDAADASMVECGQPHLFEQAGSVALTDQSTLPDDRQWRQLVNERCGPVVLAYTGGKYDPHGRYRVGALKPSAAKWEDGDRELRCGLQSASRSGALFAMTGRAAEVDQSAVQQPGTCLAIDGRGVGDPVDCKGPHAVETVGIVDLSAKFADKFPQTGDQDAYLQPECTKIAKEYAGSAEAISTKKLTVYWDNLNEKSWAAGTRKVNCNLAALLPDRSGFAPVTGPVKGDVVVGETPAPPASNTPAPGPGPVEPPIDGPPAEHPPPTSTPPDSGTKPTQSPAATTTPAPTTTTPPPGGPVTAGG